MGYHVSLVLVSSGFPSLLTPFRYVFLAECPCFCRCWTSCTTQHMWVYTLQAPTLKIAGQGRRPPRGLFFGGTPDGHSDEFFAFGRVRGEEQRSARRAAEVDTMPGWIAFIPILLVYGSVVLTWFLKKFLRANPPEDEVRSEEQLLQQQQTEGEEHKEKTE